VSGANSAAREIVFIGTSDLFRIRLNTFDSVQGRYVPFPFENATRITLEFAGLTIDETSFGAGSTIDTSEGGGALVFRLGATPNLVPVTQANAVLRVFDPVHPSGQTLASPALPLSGLQITVSN